MENRIQVSANFFLDEFIDPHTYLTRADHGMNLIDHRLFDIAQRLRELYGKALYINTWWDFQSVYEVLYPNYNALNFLFWCENKQVRVWSGYRSAQCVIGAPQSAHKKGLAIDPQGPGKLLYTIVKENAREFYDLGVRRLEDYRITPSWSHLDTWERNTQPDSIRVVDLRKEVETIYFTRK